MSGFLHSTLDGTTNQGIHRLNQFEYADSTARLAATGFVAADVNKSASELDTETMWLLTSFSPIVWKEITPSSPAHTHSHSDATGQTVNDHHSRDHAAAHGPSGVDALRLDNLEVPEDNTDLDASTSKHGLLQKLPGGTTDFLRADGAFVTPPDNDTIYTHPNHSGEITSTGDGAQVLTKTAISNRSSVDITASDILLYGDVSDSDNLKKSTVQKLLDLLSAGLKTKSGLVAGASFSTDSGEKIFDIVFSAAFSDANYAISMDSTVQRSWIYSAKVAGGFRIHAGSNSDLTGEVIDWHAIKNGES